jgi:hypothetical protein
MEGLFKLLQAQYIIDDRMVSKYGTACLMRICGGSQYTRRRTTRAAFSQPNDYMKQRVKFIWSALSLQGSIFSLCGLR